MAGARGLSIIRSGLLIDKNAGVPNEPRWVLSMATRYHIDSDFFLFELYESDYHWFGKGFFLEVQPTKDFDDSYRQFAATGRSGGVTQYQGTR
jgi:hypothetical protein